MTVLQIAVSHPMYYQHVTCLYAYLLIDLLFPTNFALQPPTTKQYKATARGSLTTKKVFFCGTQYFNANQPSEKGAA